MCHKTVKIYRQTFRNSDPTKSQQTFMFNRIYKTKQSDQFFRISVMGISGIAADGNANNYLLLKNLPEMTMYSNFQAVSATGVLRTIPWVGDSTYRLARISYSPLSYVARVGDCTYRLGRISYSNRFYDERYERCFDAHMV